VQLWGLVRQTVLQNGTHDTIKWKLSATGEYSTASAYKAQFLGTIAAPNLSCIWRTWAPPKCKFFAWLILQNRVWSADRLATRGWPHNATCALCRQTMETALHLLAECRFTRRIWDHIALWVQEPLLKPSNWKIANTALEWWINIMTTARTPRKALRSLALLIMWVLWNERNARIFNRKESSFISVIGKIKEEVSAWIVAGARPLGALLLRD